MKSLKSVSFICCHTCLWVHVYALLISLATSSLFGHKLFCCKGLLHKVSGKEKQIDKYFSFYRNCMFQQSIIWNIWILLQPAVATSTIQSAVTSSTISKLQPAVTSYIISKLQPAVTSYTISKLQPAVTSYTISKLQPAVTSYTIPKLQPVVTSSTILLLQTNNTNTTKSSP